MAKPDPITGSLPIVRQTTVEWECPSCGRANGIPEITVCACGAVRDGSTVTVADKQTTATGDDTTVDIGK